MRGTSASPLPVTAAERRNEEEWRSAAPGTSVEIVEACQTFVDAIEEQARRTRQKYKQFV